MADAFCKSLPVIGVACSNPSMAQQTEMLTGAALGAALREAMARKNVTQADVADAFGIRQPSVSEWLRYGRIAKKHIPKLVAYFMPHVGPAHWGLPEVWGGGQSPLTEGVAQTASLGASIVFPQVTWETLKMTEVLPQKFKLHLRDDAMAPRFPKGSFVEFEQGLEPRGGDVVLAKDALGDFYVRYYRQRRVNEWSAHAENPAFEPLHSDRDGLQVVAVLVGGGWSGRLG